jgi:cytidylate kinase
MAIISICRGTMSGGAAMAECLAKRLHYPLVAREVVQDAASDLGVSDADLSRGMERTPRLWNRQSSERRLYIAAVQAALAEHVADGDLIYHGRAGQVLLAGLPGVLRVRLIAPIEARVRTLMEGEGMDSASAEQYIRHVDGVRARWVKMMYGEDIEDPFLYNMVINLKIACRVKVALARARETRALDLQISGHGGVVDVSGAAPALKSGQMGDQIVEIAQSVEGVEEVRLKVEWFDPYP